MSESTMPDSAGYEQPDIGDGSTNYVDSLSTGHSFSLVAAARRITARGLLPDPTSTDKTVSGPAKLIYSQPPSLPANKTTDNTETDTSSGTWQAEAWQFHDLVGEQHFLAGIIASKLSQAHLLIARVNPEAPGDVPKPVTDPDINAVLSAFGGSAAGRSQLLARMSVNLFVAGEGWFAGVPKSFLDPTPSYSAQNPYPPNGTLPTLPGATNGTLPGEGDEPSDYVWRMLSVSEVTAADDSVAAANEAAVNNRTRYPNGGPIPLGVQGPYGNRSFPYVSPYQRNTGPNGPAYIPTDPFSTSNPYPIQGNPYPAQAPGTGPMIYNSVPAPRVKLNLDRGVELTTNPDEVYLIRVWRPHPRLYWEADSPTRSCLPILKELVGLTMHVSAQTDSRLAGAGVFLVPQSAQEAMARAAGLPPDSADDPFTISLMDAMLTPIADRSNASAVVPLVATVPDATTSLFRHISFSTNFDAEARALREEALNRLALSQDVPADILRGSSGGSHWAAWLTREETITTHVEPPLALICDALTTQYLWPVLADLGVDDPETYVLTYDVRHLITRPNLGQDALNLYDRKALSDDALRRSMGFDNSDSPSPTDISQRVAIIVADMIVANPALISRPGAGVLVQQLTTILTGGIPVIYDPANPVSPDPTAQVLPDATSPNVEQPEPVPGAEAPSAINPTDDVATQGNPSRTPSEGEPEPSQAGAGEPAPDRDGPAGGIDRSTDENRPGFEPKHRNVGTPTTAAPGNPPSTTGRARQRPFTSSAAPNGEPYTSQPPSQGSTIEVVYDPIGDPATDHSAPADPVEAPDAPMMPSLSLSPITPADPPEVDEAPQARAEAAGLPTDLPDQGPLPENAVIVTPGANPPDYEPFPTQTYRRRLVNAMSAPAVTTSARTTKT